MSLPMYYFLAITAIYILMTWSLYLPYRVGQLHFMTIANMAISGYFGAYAILYWGWPFTLVFISGILLSALIGFLTSLAIGDAPCFAVVIVGFTFIYITKTVIENTGALGSTMGLFGLPTLDNTVFLLTAYTFIVIVGFFIYRFDHSRLGRAASTIFTNQELAVSFGVNTKNMGIMLQTAGSALGGAGGVLYMYIMGNLSPNHFTFHLVGICMTMLFIGGYSTMWGTVLAAPLLWGIPLLFPAAVASWNIIIYGVLLISVLLLKPEGIVTRAFVHRIENKLLRLSGVK